MPTDAPSDPPGSLPPPLDSGSVRLEDRQTADGLAEPEPALAMNLPEGPPQPESGDRSLDPRSIVVGRISTFLGVGILCALTLPVVIGIAIAWPPSRLFLPLLWSIVAALLTARAWWWPELRYRHTSYRIDGRGLVIRRGVLWRTVTLVTRSRVQHTDVTQGPVERQFGLGTLVVHTAGTQYAAVPLGGLAHQTAMTIRDLLIDDEGGDAV